MCDTIQNTADSCWWKFLRSLYWLVLDQSYLSKLMFVSRRAAAHAYEGMAVMAMNLGLLCNVSRTGSSKVADEGFPHM